MARTKEVAVNFRCRKAIRDGFDAAFAAAKSTDRYGNAIGKGELQEWFLATFATADPTERAQLIRTIEAGMARWAARAAVPPVNGVGGTGPGDPSAPPTRGRATASAPVYEAGHVIGKALPHQEVPPQVDGRPVRRPKRQ